MKLTTGMNFRTLITCAALAMTAGCATTTTPEVRAAGSGAPEVDTRITVTYADPENFSEVRQFGQQNRFNRVNYLEPLKTHLIKQATRMLPPGDRLDVTITDIKLAGGYEPWHGPNMTHVRFMKDIYPPRIDLTFTLIGSNGEMLQEGSRKLRNLGYLQSGVGRLGDSDPLRYDKALIDSWLRRGADSL